MKELMGLSASDWELIVSGAFATVEMFLLAMAAGIVAGVAYAVARASVAPAMARLAWPVLDAQAAVSRGVPMLVQILAAVYAPGLIGLQPDPLVGSLVALALFATASIGEIGRGSLDALPDGQWLAAQSSGMSWAQAMRFVLGPQAIRIAIPPFVGFAAQLMKATSIASIVGTAELTRSGAIIATRSAQPLLAYLAIGVVYLVLTVPLIAFGQIAERRTAYEL